MKNTNSKLNPTVIKKAILISVIANMLLVIAATCKDKPKKEPEVEAPEFRVQFILGKAERKKNDGWQTLKKGQILKKNDVIRTKKKSTLDINIAGLASIRLLSKTRLKLNNIEVDKIRATIPRGDILVKVAQLKKNMEFKIVSPTAVAGVRGTEFWGQVKKKGKAGTFAVKDGSIELTLKASGEKVIVKKGQAIDYSAKGKKLKVRKSKKGERKAMAQMDDMDI